MSVVLEKAYNETAVFVYAILLSWFESFAQQNLQAFFNNEVTNANICTKHKPNFILRELYFIYERI